MGVDEGNLLFMILYSDYSSVCNIESRIVWVSMREIYHFLLYSHGCKTVNTYKASSSYGVKIK